MDTYESVAAPLMNRHKAYKCSSADHALDTHPLLRYTFDIYFPILKRKNKTIFESIRDDLNFLYSNDEVATITDRHMIHQLYIQKRISLNQSNKVDREANTITFTFSSRSYFSFTYYFMFRNVRPFSYHYIPLSNELASMVRWYQQNEDGASGMEAFVQCYIELLYGYGHLKIKERIADVVTRNLLIEIKHVNTAYNAIGQVSNYSISFPDKIRFVYVFGVPSQNKQSYHSSNMLTTFQSVHVHYRHVEDILRYNGDETRYNTFCDLFSTLLSEIKILEGDEYPDTGISICGKILGKDITTYNEYFTFVNEIIRNKYIPSEIRNMKYGVDPMIVCFPERTDHVVYTYTEPEFHDMNKKYTQFLLGSNEITELELEQEKSTYIQSLWNEYTSASASASSASASMSDVMTRFLSQHWLTLADVVAEAIHDCASKYKFKDRKPICSNIKNNHVE